MAAYRFLPATSSAWSPSAPAAIGSLALLAFDAVAGMVALARIADLGRDSSFTVVLDDPNPVTEPLLTVPSALVPMVFLALLPKRDGRPAAPWWRAGAVVGGIAAVATLASYDVPLAVVVSSLGLVAVGSLVLGLADSGDPADRLRRGRARDQRIGGCCWRCRARRSSPSPPAWCWGSR